MTSTQLLTSIAVKNILYLTDFSEASEAALPFAAEIASAYGAKIFALHILVPSAVAYMTPESPAAAIEWQEKSMQEEMQRIEKRLHNLPHEMIVKTSTEIWPALDHVAKEHDIDLIVLGTHGRTGFQKVLLGSSAEEIFRRSRIPIITIGPWVRKDVHTDARFRRVLFATDFSPASLAAAPYAISLAQENEARLTLLHVMPKPSHHKHEHRDGSSVAEALHQLLEIIPDEAEFSHRPETVVEHGDPAEEILAVARDRSVSLIVLGIRDANHLGLTTHLERTIGYQIVSHAHCPVLTIRR